MSTDVVIAGGGVGALEGLLALQSLLAPEAVRISVVCGARHLTYRAFSTAAPFGGDTWPRVGWDRIARDRGVRWVPDVLVRVRPGKRTVETRDGPDMRYDALLLALGARPEPSLPGALTFSGPRDVLAVMDAVEALEPGRRHRVAFVAGAGASWTLPLYELALLTAEHGRRRRLDLAIELVTTEAEPLEVLGAAASADVARTLDRAGVQVRTGALARSLAGGRLLLEPDGGVEVDLAIALARLRGREVPGLPHDEQGFVPVDPYCRVRDVEGVWAVGDMTARALKHGALATQQADVAAAGIAAAAGAPVEVEPYRPVPEAVLLTGGEPQFLQAEPPAAPEGRGDPLWWRPHKVVGRHLGPYLERLGGEIEPRA